MYLSEENKSKLIKDIERAVDVLDDYLGNIYEEDKRRMFLPTTTDYTVDEALQCIATNILWGFYGDIFEVHNGLWVPIYFKSFFRLENVDDDDIFEMGKAFRLCSAQSTIDIADGLKDTAHSVICEYASLNAEKIINTDDEMMDIVESFLRDIRQLEQDKKDHERGFRSDTDEQNAYDYGF